MITSSIICLIQMITGYILLCLVLPAFVLHTVVSNRSLGFRLVFYQTSANLYIIFWGFILAYLNQFSSVLLWLTIVVIPVLVKLWCIRKTLASGAGKMLNLYNICHEELMGFKMIRTAALENLRKFGRKIRKDYLSCNYMQIIAWIVFAAFIIFYFGYFKLHHYAYAYTDEETHLYWIQSLLHSKPFPAGLYPHGMHFLVASLVALFRIPVVMGWHVFNVLSALLIFWSLYMMLRSIFTSKAAAIAGVGIVLFADIFRVVTYFRYQYSLPMEFGFVTLFVLVIALQGVMKHKDRLSLVFFVMALVWTFQVHFYLTIAAVFVCLAFGLVYFIPMIRAKILHKVIIAGLVSIILMILPFAAGYGIGFTFERSIAWGLDIMSGGDGTSTLYDDTAATESSGKKLITKEDLSEEELADVETWEKLFEQDLFKMNPSEKNSYLTGLNEYNIGEDDSRTYIQSHVHDWGTFRSFLASFLYKYTFGSTAAIGVIAILVILMISYGIAGLIFGVKRKNDTSDLLSMLLAVTLWGMILICHIMPILGYPALIEVNRSAALLAVMSALIFAAPFEFAHGVISKLSGKNELTDMVLGILVLVMIAAGYFGGMTKQIDSLVYDIAVQDIDLKLCNELLEEHEDFKWTVISPVNDLSVIRYQGYHYEIIDLLEEIEKGEKEIFIPTPEIYVVVEEDVIDFSTYRGDYRMVDGSDYLEFSQHVNSKYVKASLEEIGLYEWPSRDRAYYEGRLPVMSKLYYWVKKMEETYPEEVSVYDRDEYCTVYLIKQDPYFLLNLAVDYQEGF